MYIVYLAGGIASGKSHVAKELELRGATRIDLDQVSRDVLTPGHPCLAAIADCFGTDILDDKTGLLDRALLAERAFATAATTEQLEAIEHPFIKQQLIDTLMQERSCNTELCVVEIPLLDKMEDLFDLADEILVVVCPVDIRRERALLRGTQLKDFEARVALQPSDEYLAAVADTIFDNSGTQKELESFVQSWWEDHGFTQNPNELESPQVVES